MDKDTEKFLKEHAHTMIAYWLFKVGRVAFVLVFLGLGAGLISTTTINPWRFAAFYAIVAIGAYLIGLLLIGLEGLLTISKRNQ